MTGLVSKQADTSFALTMRSSPLAGASKRSWPIVLAGTDALAAWGGMQPPLQSKASDLLCLSSCVVGVLRAPIK